MIVYHDVINFPAALVGIPTAMSPLHRIRAVIDSLFLIRSGHLDSQLSLTATGVRASCFGSPHFVKAAAFCRG